MPLNIPGLGSRRCAKHRWELGALSALCLIGLTLYGRSLTFGYFIFDDPRHIFLNENLYPPTWLKFRWIWTHSIMAMTFSLWATISALFGVGSPTPFRFANLILHVSNSFLVFVFLRMVLTELFTEARKKSAALQTAALGGALLFLVHPIQVEAVVWISAAKDLLSFFFGMLALIIYFEGRTREEKGWIRPVAVNILLALGLLSKASTAVVVLLIFWLDWIIFRRGLKQFAIEYGASMLAGLAAAIIYLQRVPNSNLGFIPDLQWRVLIAFDSIHLYFRNLLVPVSYYFDYGRTPLEIMREAVLNPAVFVFSAATSFFLIAGFVAGHFKKESGPIFLCLGLVMIPVFPYTGIIPFTFQNISTVADRFAYFSTVGVATLAGYLLLRMSLVHRMKSVLAVGALVIAGLAMRAHFQVATWKDPVTCLAHAVAQNPKSPNSRTALAHALLAQGLEQEALEQIRIAESLKNEIFGPDEGEAVN